ncbi:MAG: TatD family hydrolase [Bacilli bacterium]|nr:TatD family hydrolase [Bacilli bacterium]
MFIDTHCHLSYEDYDDIDLVIKENCKANVEKIIISGCSKEWISESLKLADLYDDVYVTLGYHPSEVDVVTDEMLNDLKKQLKNKKVVGLGEIGLDYYYGKDNKEKQLELFEKQLKIAEAMNLKVVIHSRDATEDTINCLKKYNVSGVIHCFSGSVETAKIYVAMGYKLGIGGVVTFKNSKLFEVVQAVGLENIVLETDAPYLAPTPFRGQKNSSKFIPIIAEEIGKILNKSVQEVASVTTNNAYELFDLR